MQRLMSLEDMEFYEGLGVRETKDGFEMKDLALKNLTVIVPKKFYMLVNGDVLDPMHMLKLEYVLPLSVMTDWVMRPLEIRYVCGYYEERGGEKCFMPVDPMKADVDHRCNAIKLQASWDVRDNVVDFRWGELMKNAYGDRILDVACYASDSYHSDGHWTWLLKIDPDRMLEYCELAMLVVNFIREKQNVIKKADEYLVKFEQEKAKFREKIATIVEPLVGQKYYTIDQSNEDETVVKRQISLFTFKVCHFRHDAIGLADCANEFSWEST